MKRNSFIIIILLVCFLAAGSFFVFSSKVFAKTLLDSLFGTSLVQPIQFEPNVSIPGSQFQKGGSTEIDCKDAEGRVVECKGGSNEAKVSGNLAGQYIAALYRFFIGIAGIIAVIMIAFGGFAWLFSGGSSEKITKAKEIIFGAVTGLLLALVSYLILYTINPQLVNFKLAIPVVEKSASGEVKYCSMNAFRSKDAENFYGDCGQTFNLSIRDLQDQRGCVFTKCPLDAMCVKEGGVCDEYGNCTGGQYSCRKTVSLNFPEDAHASWPAALWTVDSMGGSALKCGMLQHRFSNNYRILNTCSSRDDPRYCVLDIDKKITTKGLSDKAVFQEKVSDVTFVEWDFQLGTCAL